MSFRGPLRLDGNQASDSALSSQEYGCGQAQTTEEEKGAGFGYSGRSDQAKTATKATICGAEKRTGAGRLGKGI